MADPTTENPLAQSSHAESSSKDVLTLHRGIFGRWSGAEDGSLLQRLDILGAGRMVVAAEQMIAGLPGLASLGGSFGKQAWEMAGSIASSPQLLGRLGLQSRSLNVSELADLIQVVLEELEPADGSELATAQGEYRSSRKAAAASPPRKTPQIRRNAPRQRALQPAPQKALRHQKRGCQAGRSRSGGKTQSCSTVAG